MTSDSEASMRLRIAAIFIVALTSLLGTFIAPIAITIAKYRSKKTVEEEQNEPTGNITGDAPNAVTTTVEKEEAQREHEEREAELAKRTTAMIQPVLRVLSAFSTGIVLGTSTLHLLPEAVDFMDEALVEPPHLYCRNGTVINPEDEDPAGGAVPTFPWAELIAVLTAFAMYIFEKEVFAALERHTLANRIREQEEKRQKQIQAGAAASAGDVALAEEDAEATAAAIEEQQQETWHVVYSHVVELALSIHSVILGLTVGLITHFSTVRVLVIAVAIDQFSDGVAVGATLSESKSLSLCHRGVLRGIFAWTCSLGIAIGVVIESRGGSTDPLAQGILASMSAGMLLLLAMAGILPGLVRPFPSLRSPISPADADTGRAVEAEKQLSMAEQDEAATLLPSAWRWLIYLCMCIGFTVMAVIARFGG